MEALVSVVLPVLILVVVGYLTGQIGIWGTDGVNVLTRATFIVFMPPLLFKAMANVDFEKLSYQPIAAYFSAAWLTMLIVFLLQRRFGVAITPAMLRSISACFSNTVLLGIPIVQLSFGQEGLAILLILVALHSLLLISTATVMIEFDQHRERSDSSLGLVAVQTVRSAIIHPVVLPILLGLAWGFTGIKLPQPIDQTLSFIGQAGPPASLVLLGASLTSDSIRLAIKPALCSSFVKLLIFPTLVFFVAKYLFEINGMTLAVLVLTAALPTGANAYLLSQRYNRNISEASAGIAVSTVLSILTLSLLIPWLQTL